MAAPDKIDVGQLAAGSYTTLISNFPTFLKIARLPFATLAGLGCLLLFLQDAGLTYAPWVVFALIDAMVMLPVITAWHRLVLLGFDNPSVRTSYTIDWEEWIYIKKSLILIAAYLAATGMMSTLAYSISNVSVLALLLVSANIGLVGLFGRACLVLPAAAIGRDMSFGRAFSATSGHTWRLILLFILISIPPTMLSLMLDLAAATPEGGQAVASAGNYLMLIVGLVPNFLLVPIHVAAMSLLYRRLEERSGPPAVQ